MADWADACPRKSPIPTSLDNFDGKGREPLERRQPCLARFINGSRRCPGTTLFRSLLGIDQLKTIMIFNVGDHGID
jgi:hypothetical protein